MTPFGLVSLSGHARRAPKEELLLQVRAPEHAAVSQPPTSALVCLQDARYLSSTTRRYYSHLAAMGGPVRMYGRGLQARLAPGVVGCDLDDDDPLADQWTLVMTGAHPVCFAAQDLVEPHQHDRYRTFQWAMTTDSRVVDGAAELLALERRH